jgi:SAM-dependent methyltransferase
MTYKSSAGTAAPPQFQLPDWGLGRYEQLAAELEPVAEHVVELAALRPGERVLDLGCGTGNAALLAARAGAAVTGLDPAARLLGVARERFGAEALAGAFLVGDAHALPFDDGAFDVVLSVFGVIFAPNAERALTEMMRVLTRGGRALISAWVPGGAIDAMIAIAMTSLAEATPGAIPPRFAWHDPVAVGQLGRAPGPRVRARDGQVVFTARSADSYLTDQETHHPLAITARATLERSGSWETTRAAMLDALRAGNEDPLHFRATSHYRVLELRHH